MKTVDKKTFYEFIGPLDVVLSSVGDYPYSSEYRLRYNGTLKGKVINTYSEDDEFQTATQYLINE